MKKRKNVYYVYTLSLHVIWQATRNAQYLWPMADSRSGDVQKSWVVVMESQSGLESSYYDVDSRWWVVSRRNKA